VKIRVGLLHSDRIGHFAGNTENYLCEIEKFEKQDSIDLFYFPRSPCNQQLADMWKRELHVLPYFLMRPLDLIIRSIDLLADLRIYKSIAGDRDVNNLINTTKPHLSFNSQEINIAESILKKHGINIKHKKFVCLMVRDNSYLKGNAWDYHNYRDTDVQDYKYAVRSLIDRGYTVFRMGKRVNDELSINNQNFIDYAFSEMKTDLLDIYLCAKCEFFISTGTGLDAVALIFRRPIVYVNYVPLGHFVSYGKDSITIVKHHYSIELDKYLNMSEIFTYGVGYSMHSNDYEDKDVKLIDNSPEEIRDAVIEMVDRLEGKWKSIEGDDVLQAKFKEKFQFDALDDNGNLIHSKENSARYSTVFLRNNPEWVE